MNLTDNLTSLILAIIALFAVGIAITFKIKKKSKVKKQNLRDVSAGGDIVLGDKKTNVNE